MQPAGSRWKDERVQPVSGRGPYLCLRPPPSPTARASWRLLRPSMEDPLTGPTAPASCLYSVSLTTCSPICSLMHNQSAHSDYIPCRRVPRYNPLANFGVTLLLIRRRSARPVSSNWVLDPDLNIGRRFLCPDELDLLLAISSGPSTRLKSMGSLCLFELARHN